MAGSVIGRLQVLLGLNTAAFETGSRKAQREAQTLQSKIVGMTKVTGAALAGFGAGIVIGGLQSAVTGAFELGAAMQEAAARTGLTVEALQELRVAAAANGVSNEQLETSMARLNVQLGKLQTGEKAAVAAFEAIGLAADELKGKTPQEAFGMIADGLMAIEDPAQRAAAAQALFGRSYATLIPLIEGGSRALEEHAEVSRRSGQLTTEDAAALDELSDTWDLFQTHLSIAVAKIISTLVGYLKWSVGFYKTIIDGVKDMVLAIRDWVTGTLAAVWDSAMNKLRAVGATFEWLYDVVVGHSHVPDMVDGIASEMARLDAVMVQPARAATGAVSQSMREMAQDVTSLLDRLFPEVRRLLDYRRDLATIEGSGLSPELQAEARRRRGIEFGGGGMSVTSELDPPKLTDGMADVGEAIGKLAEKSKIGTVAIAESFKTMATDTLQALGQLTSAIKGGGFFDILQAAIGLGLQLAGAGVFGTKAAAFVNRPQTPGLAGGGSITFGGMGGMDRNLLSLNGTPLARVSRGETAHIVPANNNGAGGGNGVLLVRLEKDGGLTAHLEGVAGRVVEQAAPRLIAAGGRAGVAMTDRRRDRSL